MPANLITKLISIVVPVYNEEETIETFYETVKSELNQFSDRYNFEFIFTDNCSTDSTFSILRTLAEKDLRVKAVRFSRNFGYQKSIFTGYCLASGDASIQMDCDLQDPPSLIQELILKWEEGHEVVYGIRVTRAEIWFLKVTRQFFYRIINFLSEDHLPPDAGDFRLVDRKVITQLTQLYDANPYLRGTIAAMGFRQIGIPYHRPQRMKGQTKFRFHHYLSLAFDGILNHSVVPLRLATFVGLVTSLSLILYFLGLTALNLIFYQAWPRGFATTSSLILIAISLNSIFLGVIGEYLGRIYQQVKRLPMTTIDQMVNLNPSGHQKSAEVLPKR